MPIRPENRGPITVLLALAALLAMCHRAEGCRWVPWNAMDYTELAASTVDGLQTVHFLKRGYEEGGPLAEVAGHHPSPLAVFGWGAVYEVALHGAINCGLPHDLTLGVAIVGRMHFVMLNRKLGD